MKSRTSFLIAVIVTIAALAPFLGKAFHIDDPLFVWAGQQISKAPANPWGFDVNWTGTPLPMWQVTQNPPLTSYFIALFGALFGWSEVAQHAGFLFFAVVAIAGTWLLGKRLSPQPLDTALLALFAPVFLISASTVMSDVAMLAFFIWAILFWLAGFAHERPWMLWVAAGLTAVAGLTKYFGIALVPLLAAYAIARGGAEKKKWVPPLILPIVVWAAWDFWTRAQYGEGHLSMAMFFAGSAKTQAGAPLFQKLILGLSFTGGCMIATLVLLPFLFRKAALAGFAVIGVFTFLIASSAQRIGNFEPPAEGQAAIAVHLALFVIGGLALLILAAREAWEKRDAYSILIALWIFGTFAFAAVVNWTVNGRSILPLAPAAALLIVRRLPPMSTMARALSFAIIAAIALAAAWGDYALANAQRSAARSVTASRQRPVWFLGHWGFQYAMEAAGARPVDGKAPAIQSGDILVIPQNNSGVVEMTEDHGSERQPVVVGVPAPATTMHAALGAGFYADTWGPLPYAFGRVPPEEYEVWEMR